MPAPETHITLPSGDRMPSIGLGCWQSPKEELVKAVQHALQVGYRHIDGATIYGNEESLGEGIRLSDIARKDIWVTTKLWNTEHHPKDVIPALNASLGRLGLDYVDLWLMHYPAANAIDEDGKIVAIDISYVDTWKAMEECVELGLANNIGVSNFSKKELEHLLANCRIRPALHQMEKHCYLPQKAFTAYHKEIGLHITAYSPLGNTNPSFADRDGLPPILENPVVVRLAAKYQISPANVLISLRLSEGDSVLPKSVTINRITENLNVVLLDPEDILAIDRSCEGLRRRYCDFGHITRYTFYEGLDDSN